MGKTMPAAETMAILGGMAMTDRRIYGAIAEAARAALPCPTADDLMEVSGYKAVSSTVEAMQRLEAAGVIVVERYQRSRRVQIVSTGQWTALPLNRAPHWRDRPPGEALPLPGVPVVADKAMGLADEIRAWAAKRNVPLSVALADLVYVGWKVEMERG
jgi:hypothetical protein